MKINKLVICFLFFIAFIATSCVDDNCYGDVTNYLRTYFYEGEKQTTPSNLTVTALGIDTILYNKVSNLSFVDLPLNPSAQSCSFAFQFDTISDEVVFTYSTTPILFSKGCGYCFEYEIISVTHSDSIIKSIDVKNYNVTASNEENISIHY